MCGHFLGVLERPAASRVDRRLSVRALLASQLRLHPDGEEVTRTKPPRPDRPFDPWDKSAIQWSCSDATFQSSALVWVGWGSVNPGGVNCETTSWI
jgi:hypothetical protein